MKTTRSPPMVRKPKAKREEIKVNYRLVPEVKSNIAASAEIAGRSENLHAEYLLRLGLLANKGIDASKLTDDEMLKKFSQVFGSEETKETSK